MPRLALVGNLSFDRIDGGPLRPGGGPLHAGRAFRALHVRGTIIARCGAEDQPRFRRAFARLGLPVELRPGRPTTTFAFTYDGDVRTGRVECIGDQWAPHDFDDLPRPAWVHLAPLLRGDFPANAIAAAARGRFVSLDAQGLTRVRERGDLRLERDPKTPDLLRHVSILKLAEEEAEALVGSLDTDALAALGPREVVVTFGSRGSRVIADGRAIDVRAHHVHADPTGSGDAFAAAYLASRVAGHAPAAAARRATALVGAMLSERVA